MDTKTKNQKDYNKRARKKYDSVNYKHYSIKFKVSEMEEIEKYCKENNIPKNTFFRQVVMDAIRRSQ